MVSCNNDEPVPAPAISISVSPESGNTAQTFTFNLGKSESRSGRGDKVFTRWDWEGDGTWDTPFTRILVYTHRYHAPDTWNPRVEMANLDGASDTSSITVPVERGYTAPNTVLVPLPEAGHIFTTFLLDGSSTRDDEDSVSQLKFMWDFEGDGLWDTPYGDSTLIRHTYPATGSYHPALQVKDPSGRVTIARTAIAVSLLDPLLVASFRCDPDSVTDNSEVRMDASASTDGNNPENPVFYRWDWENDGVWDTGWLNDPVIVHSFNTELFHFVRLQVMSQRGLQNHVVKKIRVWHKNQPPTASFVVSTLAGNIKTDFRFDGWWARDPESSPSEMRYRWDWDGNGTWDTDYLDTPALLHRYDAAGIFNTTMEVTDPGGLTSTFSKVISISSGTNETGMILDHRGLSYEYYGTVLIGDLWWFSRSLTVQDQSESVSVYDEQYYNNNPDGPFRDYGCLYAYRKLPILCPQGWRVPSREDWEKLFANYPADELYDALMPGGISDFGATLGGRRSGASHRVDEGIDQTGYFWSTGVPLDPSGSSSWIVRFDRKGRQVLKGFEAKENVLYGVRCVRER
jgi:uncharacterized protein (TIGR02145 family)